VTQPADAAAGKDLLIYARSRLDLNDRALDSIGRDAIVGPARVGLGMGSQGDEPGS
jgi:hypothetical protein